MLVCVDHVLLIVYVVWGCASNFICGWVMC